MGKRLLHPQFESHSCKLILDSLGKRLKTCARDRAVGRVVACYSVNSAINRIEQLESKLDSIGCDSLPLSRRMRLYFNNLQTWSIVEELPRGKHGEQRKSIFILEALQTVRAGAQERQIRERPLCHEGLQDNRGGRGKVGGIPVEELDHQKTSSKCQLFRERQGESDRCALVRPLNRPSLSFVAPQRNNDSKHRAGRCRPASNSRQSRPVEIAGCSIFKARSQVLEFGQLQLPLRAGRHSATAIIRAALNDG